MVNSIIKTLQEKDLIGNNIIATHVYSYIDGTTHYNRGVKIEWLSILVKELFNYYEKYLPNDKWGRIGRPIQS